MIPELAGNPFLPRIFEMFDADGDGYMGAGDLRALLEALTRLANEEERYACGWGPPPREHLVGTRRCGGKAVAWVLQTGHAPCSKRRRSLRYRKGVSLTVL